ncbi:cadherin-23-like [Mya arenaria]|uniref:cadherin-23-like n=1 Tax=Mya arenaria TaxID=6604 RepID=UPI0022E2873D|nr:cadherin-23-like [Mya arenaria]
MRIFFFVILEFSLLTGSESAVPLFNFPSSTVTVYEDIAVGSVVTRFSATDEDSNDHLVFQLANSYTLEHFNISITHGEGTNNVTAEVLTKAKLDCDPPNKITEQVKLRVLDNTGNTIVQGFTLYLTDVNDNEPVFQEPPYTWFIDEYVNGSSNQEFKFAVKDNDYQPFENGVQSIRCGIQPNTQSNSVSIEYMETFGIKPLPEYDIKTHSALCTVSVKEPARLDFETNTYYSFKLNATDRNGNGSTSITDLVIRIRDIQDTPPFFTSLSYRKTIQENVEPNTVVEIVTAIDGDRGIPNAVNYTLQDGPCSSLFQISDTGNITTREKIDRDEGEVATEDGTCVLKVMAVEIDKNISAQFGNTNSSVDVTISISDVNDNIPKFSKEVYHASIDENMPQNVPITMMPIDDEILVTDLDQGDNSLMQFSLFYENDTESFDFSVTPNNIQRNGTIFVRVNNSAFLDYEERHSVIIKVKATETANSSHTSTTLLNITINDMNDNNPQFLNSSYDFAIQENPENGSEVGNVTATDKDSEKFNIIKYTLAGGDNRFSIDETTGVLKTFCRTNCNIEFDRERIDTFYLTVTASDNGGRINSTSVKVTLTDDNDNAPKFLRNYIVYLKENDNSHTRYNGTSLVTVEAEDADEKGNNNSKIGYHIVEKYDLTNLNISINETSGAIYLNDPIDYEMIENDDGIVTIVVEAWDGGNQSGRVNVTIYVEDENDNKPKFNDTMISGIVDEDAESNITYRMHVGYVFAKDEDGTDRNSRIQYFIYSGAMDDFVVNTTTGEVTVQIGTKLLDRETMPQYNITIIAIDTGSPPLTGTTVFNVTVDDVNDEKPKFRNNSYDVSILENKTYMTFFITCEAVDLDDDHSLNYSIIEIRGVNENGQNVEKKLIEDYFAIHSKNGSVYVKSEDSLPDREVAGVIELTIQVQDVNAVHNLPQTATALLRITLKDVNDNDPEFSTENEYNVSIPENAANMTILTTIRATDRDLNRSMSYTILNDMMPGAAFYINDNGEIRKIHELDREQNENVTLQVQATDDGIPPRSSTAGIHVTITDFNDNPPVFKKEKYATSIDENEFEGTIVITMNATDEDAGPNANITYSISSGADGDFDINSTTGEIFVVNNSSLDREKKEQYVLDVEAQDNPERNDDRKFATQKVTITINDLNDNAPTFTRSIFNGTIREDADSGTNVLTIIADDDDKPRTNNSQIYYSFGNDTEPAGLFKIGSDSGVVSVNTSLKGYAGEHYLLVTASDFGEPSLQNSTTVVINVRDVNLNRPIISNIPENNTVKIYECSKVGYEVYKFNYTDADKGQNANATFNITEENEGTTLQTFQMRPNGSLILSQSIADKHITQYTFFVQATDNGSPVLSSDMHKITIYVMDVNNNMPYFTKNTTTLSVNENSPAGTVVGTVTAIDDDRDSMPCYEIKESEMENYFKIGRINGTIVTNTTIDAETNKTLTVKVTVQDCSTALNASTACGDDADINSSIRPDQIVQININDENDNPPIFPNKKITVGMRRITEVGTPLALSLKTDNYVTDKDYSEINAVNAWIFKTGGTMTVSNSLTGKVNPLSGTNKCEDGKNHVFCVSSNGSVVNNKYFSEDMSGYFILPVVVSDKAGNDTAEIMIYLIGDSQIMKMVVFGSKEEVALKKNDILSLYSNITRHSFIYDWLEDHKNGDRVDPYKTDLFFHVVNPITQSILSADDALRLVDSNSYALLQAQSQYDIYEVTKWEGNTVDEVNSIKTIYILVAIIVVLALTVAIIIYVSMVTRNRYKRKLQAVTVKPHDQKDGLVNTGFIPGSNHYSKQSNPLLNAEIPDKVQYDNISIGSQNSIDSNAVGERGDGPIYDKMEEKGMTLDMFNEDKQVFETNEHYLEAALRLHDLHNMKDKPDNTSTEGIFSPADVEKFEFENNANLEGLESSEI